MAGSGTISWAFATSSKPIVITAGSSYTLTLWGDVSQILAITNQGLSLTASIKNVGDFGYLDGTNGTPSLHQLDDESGADHGFEPVVRCRFAALVIQLQFRALLVTSRDT